MPIERTTSPALAADRPDAGPSAASRPADPPVAARFAKSLQRELQQQKSAPGLAQQGTVTEPEPPAAVFGAGGRDIAESATTGATTGTNPDGKPRTPLRRAHALARQSRVADQSVRTAGGARQRLPAEAAERTTRDDAPPAASPVPFGQPGVTAREAAKAAAPRTEPDAAEQKQFARFAAAIAEPGANAPTDTLSITFSHADAVISTAVVERSADARLAITLTQNTPGDANLPLPAIASLERRLQQRGLSGYRLAITRRAESEAADRDG
ncbi:MAG: hypothetical protein ACKVOB_10440 [Sphingomonas sp.]